MRRFPEDAKEGEPQALIPETEAEWLGIETDISNRTMLRIVLPVLLASGIVTGLLIAYWLGCL